MNKLKSCRVWICAVAIFCVLCSGCTEHISAEDIEDIQPMTRREFELAYKDEYNSQLYQKYREYNQGDNVVEYEIIRNNNIVKGSFFDISDIVVTDIDNRYYFDYNNKVYEVADVIKECKDSNINVRMSDIMENIVSNISKTYITDISNNVEIHKSRDNIDNILRGNSTINGKRSEITITFLKNYIHIEMYDVTLKQKTTVNMTFSAPNASQHNAVNSIKSFINKGEDKNE